MNAVIYCRKSTDRTSTQLNSLPSQRKSCLELLKKNRLELFMDPILADDGFIEESVSAKDEGKRPGFMRLITWCKQNPGKVDYIIADEASRLSRNSTDAAKLMELLEKGAIKGVITSSGVVSEEMPETGVMLEIGMLLAKSENKRRSIHVKTKMRYAASVGKYMGKAIFGYQNVTIRGEKDIEVVPEEAVIIREVFMMRANGSILQEIANYVNKNPLVLASQKLWSPERVDKALKNTKYYGVQKFGGVEAPISSSRFSAIVSRELFDRANKVVRGVEYQTGKNTPLFLLTGILKDPNSMRLSPYEKKGHVYYHTQVRAGIQKHQINISQKKVLEALAPKMKSYNFPESIAKLSREYLKEYFADKVSYERRERSEIEKELALIKERQRKATDCLIDGAFTKDVYQAQIEGYKKDEELLKERQAALSQTGENALSYIQDMCELATNLYQTYILGNDAKKAQILRAMQCELFIDNKKELVIKENKLFALIREINFNIGDATENRTPIAGMRIPCPNR